MTMNIMPMRLQAGTETDGRIGEGDNAGEPGRFADVLTQQTDAGKNAKQAKADHGQQTVAVKPDESDIAASGTAVQDEKTVSMSASSSPGETANNPDAEPANTTGPEPSLYSISTTTPINTVADAAQDGERSAKDTVGDVSARAASAPMSAKTAAEASPLSGSDAVSVNKAGAESEAEAEGSDSMKSTATDADSLTRAGRSTTVAESALSYRPEGGSQLPPTTATKAEQQVANKQVADQQAFGKQLADSPSAEQTRKADTATLEGETPAPVKGAREPAVSAAQTVANPDFSSLDEAEDRAAQKQAERVTPGMTATPPAATQTGASLQNLTTPAATRPKVMAEAAPLDTRRDMANDETADALVNKDTSALRQQEATSARTPEWLAQIEHGRRWSQPELRAGAQADAGDNGKALPSVALAEGEAEQENPTERVSTASGALEPTPSALLSSRTGGDGVTAMNQAPVGQDAGMQVVNRDGIQSGSTSERTPLLERVVTLQQGAPEQSAKQLSQQVQVMVNQNLQEAEIRLDPSNLGGLRIQVKMEQGEVQVQFLASHPQARELLDQALPRLRDMLSQQGLNLSQNQGQSGSQQGGFNQTAQQDAQQQSQQDAQQRGEGRSNGPRGYGSLAGNETQTSLVDEALLSNRTDDAGRIDFFA